MSFLDKFKDIIKFERLTGSGKEQATTTTTTTTTTTDYSTLKVAELKKLAKERGLKGYSTLKKTELVELLKN